MTGTLYIVATPIGNLGDITLRALEILKVVDDVYCEDTRVTSVAMKHFGIRKPLHAYHQHSGLGVVASVAEKLAGGASVALVCDAGTPGINDPGGKLVAELLAMVPGIRVVPLPGPNAAITALSVSGLPADRYRYLGFVPQKKGRSTFFSELADYEDTAVFYESKHRITKTLQQLQNAMEKAQTPQRPVMVARELTKQFETLYRGTAAIVRADVTADKGLGEFVVVVGPKNWK